MNIKQLTNRDFGAFVYDIDLSKPLTVDEIVNVKHIIYKYKVVAFPDQILTLDEYQTFANQLGTFCENPFLTAVSEKHPNIVAVERKVGETVSEVALYGGAWHADFTLLPNPPEFTLLYSEIIPPEGGNTLFADQVLAYKTLNSEIKDVIEGKNAMHTSKKGWSIDGVYSKNKEKRTMKIETSEVPIESIHPIIGTHPVTKEKALQVNLGFTMSICGMESEDSKDLLNRIYKHQTQPEHIFEFKYWKPNMVLIWDNRTVIHKATGGYDNFERKLYRIVINEHTFV